MSVKLAWATSALLAGLATAAVAQPAAPITPAAAPARPSMAAGVAAIVNDEVVSAYDVTQRANLLLAGSGIEPSQEAFARARVQALRDLVDERLQLQEASERKIKVEPAEIDRAIADIARQNGTSAETLRNQLTESGIGIQTLRTQIESDMAWRRLVGGRYGSRIRISQVQVTEALGRIVANSSKPQALVSEILLAAETESDLQQAEQGAATLLQQIRAGAPFQNVARQFSSASSAAAGGDLGWLAQGELRPELQGIVDQLQPGQVSRPVRGPGGVYILAVREKRSGIDLAATRRVALQQVTAPKQLRQAFERTMRRVQGCENLQAAVQPVTGAAVVDLGEASESELSQEVRDRIENVREGDASATYETPDGALAALVVCQRTSSGNGVPSRQEVENRLYEQELAMLSQRYLRNLRRDSTIITRQQ